VDVELLQIGQRRECNLRRALVEERVKPTRQNGDLAHCCGAVGALNVGKVAISGAATFLFEEVLLIGGL